MSGRAAVAQALIQAGNLDGAEREALALLERDPHDRDGLEVLTTVALRKGDHERALALAEDWVAREPDWAPAHVQRILALTRAKKKRQAREALERYKADFPLDRQNYDALWAGMQMAFGKPEAAVRKIGAMQKEHGDELRSIEAIAKDHAGQLIGASRAADRALENDPLDATALNIKATSAFRLCRFSKARALARQLRQLDPRKAARANELIYASYVAYFPPFLIAHVFAMLVTLMTSRFSVVVAAILCFMVGQVVALPVIAVVEILAEESAIPNFRSAFYYSVLGWWAYLIFVFQRFSRRRGAAKSVQLSSNY